MRNRNDSFATQHYPANHKVSPPSAHQLSVPSSRSSTLEKMEPHYLARNVGVGTNPKQPTKSHFSPVDVVAPSAHHFQHHHNNFSGHHNSYSDNCTSSTNNSNNPNSIPINLSHASATTSMISPMSENITSAAAIVSHLPSVALAAACPTTTTRGPSPAHHQQGPINGLPYHHSSHSPTLPVAHTALPSEVHSNSTSGMIPSNRSSPLSLPQPPHVNSAIANSPYHPTQYHVPNNFNQVHNLPASNPNGIAADLSQTNNPNSCSPTLNVSSHHDSTSPANAEVTRSTRSLTQSEDSRSSSSVADSNNNTSARIVSQNVNGTYAITGIPSNGAELQVFRVMQRANLLSYFDKMIENGGDDVQQLCDAEKEEFLEIMSLIGMASKPLHVRRLQKALQEWMTQPGLFQSPVLPAGYQQHFGVSHIDRTISHTQFTTTIAAATSSGGGAAGYYPSPSQSSGPVIPIPHLIPHNSTLPYPAQSAPYALDPPKNSSASISSDTSSSKVDNSPPAQNESNKSKSLRSHERSSNNSSPSLSSNAAATIVGLEKVYLQRGSPSIPVVNSTAQAHNNSGQLSSSSFADHYQNFPSPSGSTSSNSSSSTVSIKSHHQFHHPSSPLESYPDSPVNSESGRSISNKHEESSTCTELENTSSCSSDQTNSIQLLENSTGTGNLRVASRSSSYCGSFGGGSEPSSPAPPPPSFSKGILISSSSSQQTSDSPRSYTESVANRNNNSVAVTSTTSSQDFSSLQEHEIQKLAETALNIVRSLPPHVKEPKLTKKIETSSYELVRRLAEDDPRRMYEIRRLCAIFGKNGENGKRGKGSSCISSLISPSNKTMSILELAMNEAAAQLCKLLPALLTKKDEMYNLAKRVIQESGLPYSVICANSNLPSSFMGYLASSNSNEAVTTSGSNKGKIDDIRNSPAHEERISFEFAAACKKIKLDVQHIDAKETNGHLSSRKSNSANSTEGPGSVRIAEVHNPLRKSPTRESKSMSASSLKRAVLLEHRKNTSDQRRSQS